MNLNYVFERYTDAIRQTRGVGPARDEKCFKLACLCRVFFKLPIKIQVYSCKHYIGMDI